MNNIDWSKYELAEDEQPKNNLETNAFDWSKYELAEPEKPSLKQPSIEQNIKEIPSQFAKGALTGVTGSYGDILDLFGLQSKTMLPGEKAQRETEAKTLEKINQPGYKPSAAELDILSEQEPIPRYSRLPSTQESEQVLEKAGMKKPETISGRFAERAGKFIGGGATTGPAMVKAPLLAAGAGQMAEELGAPKWVQAAIEMGTFIKSAKSKAPITSKSSEVKSEINRLRDLGFSEDDLTLAKNALEDRGWIKKTSKFTKEADDRFKATYKSTEDNFNKILEETFPGLPERGTGHIQKASSELFESLDNAAKDIVIEMPTSFVKNANKAIAEMKRTLANIPQEKEVIGLLETAIESAEKAKTADFYTRFYKGLNRVGHWGNPKEREHVFSIIKDAIKNTFRDQGPEGAKLANMLEDANKSWVKYLQAEDINNVMKKAVTDEGMNFGKLHKQLQNPDNYALFSKSLGKEQAKNLKSIAKAGEDIKGLEKLIQGGMAKEALGAGKLYSIVKAVATLDFGALKTYVAAEALGRYSTKLLTDPKYQNRTLRMLKSIKDQKWNQVRILASEIDQDLERLSSEGAVGKK